MFEIILPAIVIPWWIAGVLVLILGLLVISPIDTVPDFIPILGWIDDFMYIVFMGVVLYITWLSHSWGPTWVIDLTDAVLVFALVLIAIVFIKVAVSRLSRRPQIQQYSMRKRVRKKG